MLLAEPLKGSEVAGPFSNKLSSAFTINTRSESIRLNLSQRREKALRDLFCFHVAFKRDKDHLKWAQKRCRNRWSLGHCLDKRKE